MAVQLINRQTQLRNGGTVDATPVGYCHDLTITVASDGGINPGNITLGNKGDVNITRLTFDLSALEAAYVIDPINDYILKIIIFNRSLPYSDSNPRQYVADLNKWVVPNALFEVGASYECLLSLTERAPGHTTPENEMWMSNQFTCSINDTRWGADIETALENPIIYSDTAGYLMKPPIALNFSNDHYSMSANNNSFGNKRDVFVKRLELADNLLDEGFIYKYGVFVTDQVIYAVKFNEIDTNQYACLIPKEITANAGTYTYLMVAMTADVVDNPQVDDDGFKRWVSNTLSFTVTNNFLEDQSSGDSNFILSDGSILYTTDGLIFRVQEG